MSSSVSSADPPGKPPLKRRKIRKGTFSCWECKNRKTRCEFKTGTTCASCQRRGLPCISQEFSESVDSAYKEVGQRLNQVEALVNQLAQSPSQSKSHDIHSETLANRSKRALPTLQQVSHERMSRGSSLNGYLYSILPHPTLALLILDTGKLSSPPLQVLHCTSRRRPLPRSVAEQDMQITDMSATAHPILFGRKLIQLALCLQQLDTTTAKQIEIWLKEPVKDAANRYFDAASRYVMSQDCLVDSLDGLETLLLQGRYHISAGDLRVAWLIFRRALSIAQLMDLPRQAEISNPRAESVWFQLIFSDRFMSLMLGLPFAVDDNTFASESQLATNIPAERLERIHVVVAGRIIARNMRMQRRRKHEMNKNDRDYKETQDIDDQLKKATRLLPTSWWAIPNLDNTATAAETAQSSAKLLAQMHQHYLVLALHQPYIAQRNSEDSRLSSDFIYNKLAVHSASCELLARYLVLRKFYRSSTYRGLDDKAFTAAITLLVAHLDGHHLGRTNVLEHQRPHDLGIISRVIDLMEEVLAPNKDAQGTSRVHILKRLTDIEEDAMNGSDYYAWNEENATRDDGEAQEDGKTLKLPIPYFGSIHIAPRYMASPDLGSVWMSEPATNATSGETDNLDSSLFLNTAAWDDQSYNCSDYKKHLNPIHGQIRAQQRIFSILGYTQIRQWSF
ncbi:hypothetical protein N7474_000422 [Penicillium riverlandense]|uniref:uncharacterized protein n=1 Tax=Penicillium riverlandense TaxID=1903569 RepID=UPI002547339A|nr:uncharacterized protein N7474_000422 [Penicillium riverlandense]KAJ5832111.1 hypothetical protein N7474_000422 [Penicillium riverlandense]